MREFPGVTPPPIVDVAQLAPSIAADVRALLARVELVAANSFRQMAE